MTRFAVCAWRMRLFWLPGSLLALAFLLGLVLGADKIAPTLFHYVF